MRTPTGADRLLPLPRFWVCLGGMDHIEFAIALDGASRGTQLKDEAEIIARLKADDLAWVHLHADHEVTPGWMAEHLTFVEPPTRKALTAEVTRPRAFAVDDGLMVILRGMNLNPGSEPEDMVSLRLFLNPARIISLSRRPLKSVTELREQIAVSRGPETPGAFLANLVDRLGTRIDDAVMQLADQVDDLEEEVIAAPRPDHRAKVVSHRQEVIDLRRYLAPQRDALAWLAHVGHPVLTKADRRRLAEAHDRLVRVVEELESMRDALVVLRDEIEAVVQEKLNRNLYLLSILSAIFLPLGFLTGLMGINLGGMPGAEGRWAFWVFTFLLALVAGLQLWILRRLKWI